jgi:hypothetical protein
MNSPRDRAPIAMFVYNRAELTRQTLDALARNSGASDSDLIIFSDGAKNGTDAAQIAEVRALIYDAKGFRSVRVVEAASNRGLAPSIIAGVTAIAEERGHVIVLEDDIVTSPVFLDFMDDALDLYRNEDRVGAISGYIFPLDMALPETFFLQDEASWGWATWGRAWAKFEPDGRKLLAALERRIGTRKFDVDASFPFTDMLKVQIAGRNSSWAIRWRASIFLNDMLSLYPGGSLVRNIGTDGSGTHATQSDSMFNTVPRLEPVKVEPIRIEVDEKAAKALRRYYRTHVARGFWHRALRKLKRLPAQLI